MKQQDPALTISNPRLLAAIYFGLLSVVGTILINAFLSLLGISELIPLFKAIILGVLIAGGMGALFGEHIVHSASPYNSKVFFLGFIMVIASLPLFDLGLVALMLQEHTNLIVAPQIQSTIYLYLFVVGYSYALFGILLACASGLAALYLRSQLVYDLLHTYKESSIEKQVLPLKITKKSNR